MFPGESTIIRPLQGRGFIRLPAQGALTSFATLGCGVKRLRRKELASHDDRQPNWELLNPGIYSRTIPK